MGAGRDSQGTTIAFATSGWTVRCTSITPDDIAREVLDTTDLEDTTWETNEPTDLINAGGCEIEWNCDLDDLNTVPYDQDPEVVTITWPKQASGSSVQAALVVTAYMDRYKPPTAEMKTLLKSTAHLTFTGEPAFTEES